MVYAQDETMTPYEQKREQLAADALEKILNTLSVNDKLLIALNLEKALKSADGDRFQEMAILENLLFKFCDFGELFQTEANLLAQSFDANDAYTGQSLQSWKEIGDWYKKERIELDKSKTDLDIQREKDRADLLKELPGIAGVKQHVREKFLKWATKGEYEKTVDLNERILKKGPAKFDSLCFSQFNEMFKSELNIKVSKYDADREGHPMRFFYGEENKEKSYVDAFWTLSPKQDQSLDEPKWSESYAIGAFRKNNDIYPATYHYTWYKKDKPYIEEWDIVLGNQEPIQIPMADVLKGTSIEIMDDHVFDYTAYSVNLITRSELIQLIIPLDPNNLFHTNELGHIFAKKEVEKVLGIPAETYFISKDSIEEIKQKVLSYYDSRNKIDETLEDWFDININLINIYDEFHFEDHNKDKYEKLSILGSGNDDEISSFLENIIMEMITHYTKDDNSRYINETNIMIEYLKKIKSLSSKYKIDMDLLYSDIISKSERLSKYREYSQEEAVARFKKNVMKEK